MVGFRIVLTSFEFLFRHLHDKNVLVLKLEMQNPFALKGKNRYLSYMSNPATTLVPEVAHREAAGHCLVTTREKPQLRLRVRCVVLIFL